VAVPNVKKTVADYLQEFLQQLGNQFCADCLDKNPQWIAFPHGVIICDNCAGAHRSLGSHVSQVKSVVYDKWSMKMFHELEKCGGNTVINSTLQKYCQFYQQPNPSTSADERERFIKNKYELKMYIAPQATNDKEEAAKRLAHYFVIVCKNQMLLPEVPTKNGQEQQPQKKPLRFVMPESIFDTEFDACITDRYPKNDYPATPLPARVFDFIFPENIRIADKLHQPEKRAFVLTDAEGAKLYGVAVVFWERLSPMDILNMSETLNQFRKQCDRGEITTMPGAVYAPKAICLLSNWPFFDQFSTFLQTVYRITKTPSVPIPVERYVMNFMHEVPVPPLGKTSVQFVVGDVSITLKRAPPNTLPFLHVNGLNLFKCLSLSNVLALFNAVLQEQKTVLISCHLHLLVEAAETLIALFFPLCLQGVYMPLLPSKLLDFLHSPVPFLAGVHPSWIKGQNYDEVVFVYLDDDQILTTCHSAMEALPKRPREKLEKRLEEVLPWLSQHRSPQKGMSSKPSKHKHSMGIGGGQGGGGGDDGGGGIEEKHEDAHNGYGGGASHLITKEIDHSLQLLPISNFLTSGSTIQSTSQSDESSSSKKKNSSADTQNAESIFREIQFAFLKFFTSILENYANKYTDKQRKNDPELRHKEYVFFRENRQVQQYEFERERFLDEGIDSKFRPWVEKLVGTQIFAAFCQEREELLERQSDAIPFEIQYFDEELIAKKNRSTLRTKKIKTEFLDDRSLDVKSVFVANPPNLNDLDQSSYVYTTFPQQLKTSRFGAIRKIQPPWSTRRDKPALARTKSHRLRRHHGRTNTFAALQQLLAMQHAAHINKARSWDNFTTNVLVVQRFIRMVVARKQLSRTRAHISTLQRGVRVYHDTRRAHVQFMAQRRSAVVLQSAFRTYLMVQRNRDRVYYTSTTCLQAVFRAYVMQKRAHALYASTRVLQGVFKTYRQQQRSAHKLSAVRITQCHLKTVFARQSHMDTMTAIRRCQAVLRGTLLRTQHKKILQSQLSKSRKQMLELWHKTMTAYMYRAKFWIVYEEPTYLNLAIHNEEVDRLQNLQHRLTTNKVAMHEARSRFDAEKAELRRLLKEELSPNIRESLYTSWGINIKSKSKKDKLLNELFTAQTSPKQSATALLTICSSHSASILDVTSQVELRRADRIRDNLLLTVFSSLSSMQSLNRSLQRHSKRVRKQQVTIKTLNEELTHKQNVILKQAHKLNHVHEQTQSFRKLKLKDFSSGGHAATLQSQQHRSSHLKSASSLHQVASLINPKRRFSEIDIQPMNEHVRYVHMTNTPEIRSQPAPRTPEPDAELSPTPQIQL